MSRVPFQCDIEFAGAQELASAGAVDLSSVDGNQVIITGTSSISSFGGGVGLFRIVRYGAATPLVNSSPLGINAFGAASLTTGLSDPFGGVNGEKLVEAATTAEHYGEVDVSGLTPGGTATRSFYAKYDGTRPYINVITFSNPTFGTNAGFRFNLQTGVIDNVGATGGATQTMSAVAVGGGWWLVKQTVTLPTSDTQALGRIAVLSADGSSNVYAGNGTSGVLLYSPQWEFGYIHLTLSQNRTTTPGDICVYTSDAQANWYEVAAPLLPTIFNGILIGVTTLGVSAAVTIPTGTPGATKGYVRMWGSSGGSGGAAGVGLGASSGGSGAGAYLEKFLTGLTPGLTLTWTRGSAGIAGTSAPTNGGNGTASTLASGTQAISTLTANGSNGTAAANGAVTVGSAGGAATGGDINISGKSGSIGWADPSTGVLVPGVGGGSALAPGVDGVASIGSLAGNAGRNGGGVIFWYS